MRRSVIPAVVACLSLFITNNLMAVTATLTTLHIFNDTDGDAPDGALVQGNDGNFYGITSYGGTDTNDCIGGCGTTFEISPDGAFTSHHSFTNYDGSDPRAGLMQASDGNFYGTTSGGGFFGPGGLGTVFRMTPVGAVTMIHSFDIGGGGISPEGTLIEATDGNLYGTTSSGPVPDGGVGAVFKITTNGNFTILHGSDQSAAGVIQASDGNFYGTTQFGGTSTNCPYGCGTVFRITPDGVVTTLHSFDGSDGSEPVAALIQGSDGNLYGTTSGGPFAALNCANGCGTVFQITTNGVFTSIHAFAGTDGRQPLAGLVEGPDGNFYGTASYGGALGIGTIFQITTNGTLTRLVSFNALNGGTPAAALVLGSDGNFYGTTQSGGSTNGFGTVFKLTVQTNGGANVLVTLSPSLATNTVGATYTVTATVSSNAVALANTLVSFAVIAGPNLGTSGSATTDASGQASFSYTGGIIAGMDTVRAVSLGTTVTTTNFWIAPDSVGDGIPDWWRAQYFGGSGNMTNGQSCAACDADGTGQNNLFKYVAGLNPTNPASVFVLSAQTVANQPKQRHLIYGPTATSRTYTPEFRTNLASGAWAKLTGYGGPTTVTNQATITDRNASVVSKYYRIRISLP